jgi:RHS repeat-associated protein
VRDPDGKLIALRVGASAESTSNYYPFTDNLDNVRTMVTATGTTPEVAYTYSAYGVTTATTGNLNQPYRYGSGYTDTATGLIKLGLRYYDPVLGRFTQEDPTGQEENPYLYVLADPATLNDPNGDIAPIVVAAGVLAARASVRYLPQAASYVSRTTVVRGGYSAAVRAGRQEAYRGGARCRFRGLCASNNHVHVDYINKHGERILTHHLRWD